MALWMKVLLLTIATLGVGVGMATWIGSVRWNQATFTSVQRVVGAAEQATDQTVDFATLDTLPAPVARYFRWALTDGQPVVKTARILHDGEFRLRGEGDEGWNPFTSTQVFSAQPPSFVWDANIRMALRLPVRVRDSYMDKAGGMKGKLLSVLTVVDESGGSELAAGSLQRYLAEAVWFPTALLPECGVEWVPVDETTAVATLTDGPNTITVEFRFADSGEIVGIFSPERNYQVGPDEYVLYPWEGFFWGYEEHHGMMVPMQGEVQWNLPQGPQAYWRAHITQIEYDITLR